VASSSVQLIVDASRALNPLKQVKQAVGDLDKQFVKLKGAAKGATNNVVNFARETEKSTKKVRDQIGAVQSLIGAYAGFSTIKGLVTAGVELETATKRAELLVDRFGQLAGVQRVAAKSADTFKLSQTEVLSSLIDLGNRLGPQGASLAEIQDIYDGFNTILAINKVSSQEAASAQLQLNQALGAGKLQGEEYRAVNEATPQVIDAIAKVLKVTRGEVKQLASDGAVTAPVLIEALRSVKAEGADILQQSLDSTSGKLRDFQASQKELAQALGTELLPAFTPILKALTQAIKDFTNLPGPVKTFTAAVVALSAAVLVLNPLLTTAISLIKMIGVATLVAAGPWAALAAGIGAATLALASYQTQAEKTAKAAATGDSEAVHEARKELHAVQQDIALLKVDQATATGKEKASIDKSLARLRESEKVLKSSLSVVSERETKEKGIADLLTKQNDKSSEKGSKAKEQRDISAEQLGLETKLLEAQVKGDLMEQAYLEKLIRREQIINQEMGSRERMLALLRSEFQYTDQIKQVRQDIADIMAGAAILPSETSFGGEQGGIFDPKSPVIEHLDELKQRLKDLQDPLEMVKSLSANIADSFSQGVRGMIEGTMSAQQALANFFQSVADYFMDMATNIIKAAIEMMAFQIITSLFPGAPTFSASTMTLPGLDGAGALAVPGILPGISGGLASGGTAMGGSTYLVGEKGPELFTPGRTGSVTPNSALGGVQVGSINITVENTGEQLSPAAQKQIAGQVQGIVMSTLVNERRSGGLLR